MAAKHSSARRSVLLPVRSVAEVADAMGISRAQVLRLEARALAKARAALEERGMTFRDLLSLITPKQEP